MTSELQMKWDQAVRTGDFTPIGDLVVCDICGEDFTNSPASGGIIFGSNAYCPQCSDRMLPTIASEAQHIQAKCPQGVSFADFVRDYRGPNAGIHFCTIPD